MMFHMQGHVASCCMIVSSTALASGTTVSVPKAAKGPQRTTSTEFQILCSQGFADCPQSNGSTRQSGICSHVQKLGCMPDAVGQVQPLLLLCCFFSFCCLGFSQILLLHITP